jgi:ABC-type uncharacterized transport system involved in gliding motility auxiliary subunit
MNRTLWARVLGVLGLMLVLSTFVTLLFGNTTFVVGKLALGLAGIAAALLLGGPGGAKRFFGGRAAHFGFFTAVSAILVVVVLAAANWAATRRPRTWDLTKDRIFTLGEDTLRLLGGLDRDVKAWAFYGQADPDYPVVREALERYAARSPRFTFELVDPYRSPETVRRFAITQGGPRIVLVSGEDEARVRTPDEQGLTNGLVQVTRHGGRKAYFTTGHGEPEPRDESERGYARIVKELEGEGFEVATLSLLERPEVPADAALVVVAGARKAFLQPEVEALRRHFAGGGHVAVFLEPEVDAGLDALLRDWGIEAGNDMVVDPSPVAQLFGGSAVTPIVAPSQSHPVTRDLAQTGVAFPTTRSLVSRRDAQPAPVPLALSSGESWAEGDVKSLYGKGARKDEGEKVGPMPVAMALEKPSAPKGDGPAPVARAAVFGDAEFFSNGYVQLLGNADLFLNVASWLAEQPDRITIRPRSREASRLFLTEAQAQAIRFLTIDVLPIALLGAGLAVWLVRRSR